MAFTGYRVPKDREKEEGRREKEEGRRGAGS
jgi:hypothetical protein